MSRVSFAARVALLLSLVFSFSAYGKQSVGLVLSGGGAKGCAHIGVIQALEDNGIPIDYVTGTSMGAIVGGLYACGYTPDEMLQLILSRPFSYWSQGKVDPEQSYYFATDEPSPVMLTVPLATKKDSLANIKNAVPASLISPMPMNYAVMELFSPYTAQCGGDFTRLMVPFRCVASDVAKRHKVVLKEGDLGYSIRSSMSYPIVFQPTQLDTMLLYDGGLYDNFPYDVMYADFNPDFVLGIDVGTKDIGPQTSLLDQLSTLVMQDKDYYIDPSKGIEIDFNLNEFGLLDFPKAKQIYQIGYDKTVEMIDSIKSRISARNPKENVEKRRAEFKSKTPVLKFDKIDVYGASPAQNKYLHYLFTGRGEMPITLDDARSAYYRAIASGKLRDMVPQAFYNDTTDLFSLRLKATVQDDLKLGFGGYITSSTSSYVYLSAKYSTLSFNSMSAQIGAWLGQSYLGASLTSRLYMPTSVPSALEFDAVVFRQKYYDKDYLFFERHQPGSLLNHQYFGRMKWAFATSSLSVMQAGVGYGYLVDSFYRPFTSHDEEIRKEYNKFSLGQIYTNWVSNTLDDINYPTSGRYYSFSGIGALGSYHHYQANARVGSDHVKWLQLESVTRNYFSLSNHFSIGVESDVLLSTRKALYDYYSTVVSAPDFSPTPSSYNSFKTGFRSMSFASAGIAPIYKYNSNLSARLQGYCFVPIREIKPVPRETGAPGAALSNKWFGHAQWHAELDICFKLPFATLTGYCSYATAQVGWNVGITFGVFLPAPRYLR